MKYAFFPGCTTLYRLPGYEISTRKVAETLKIELLDLESANCCGLPIDIVHHMTSMALSARVLCLAEEAGLDIVTICNGCNSMLATVNAKLIEDRNLRSRVNDPEEPTFLKGLIEATGAKTVEYDEKRQCCGAPVLAVNEDISNRLVGVKLSSVRKTEANVMVTTCPFCFIVYNRNQPAAGETIGETFNIPVVHFTQLLGLALGLQEVELELSESCPDPEVLLKFLK